MVELNSGTHAGYYPGNTNVHLRVYFDTNNRHLYVAAVKQVLISVLTYYQWQ